MMGSGYCNDLGPFGLPLALTTVSAWQGDDVPKVPSQRSVSLVYQLVLHKIFRKIHLGRDGYPVILTKSAQVK